MTAARLSLICPDTVVDPLSLTVEMERAGKETARRYALLHNDLVELAGNAAGRRSDVVRRFAVAHGAEPDAAERYVTQWKLCRAARKAFDELVVDGDDVIDTSQLCVDADDFRLTLQRADARGMTAVLDFLLGIIAAAHSLADPLKLMARLEEPDDIDSDCFALSVLTSLIAVGRLSYEAAKATRLLQEALDCTANWKGSEAPKTSCYDPAADAIAPEDVFADPTVTAGEVTAILNRLGKRHKRMFAWMHNRLAAVSRRHFGKRPADVPAALPCAKDDPALASCIERQWREILALRDAMEPMARVMHPTMDQATGYAIDSHALYEKDENAPLRRVLKQLLCLATIATGDTTPFEAQFSFHMGDEEDPEGDAEQAVHCAILLTDDFQGGELSDDDTIDSETEDDKLSEEQMKSLMEEAEHLRDTFLLHLPRPQLAFLVISLHCLVPMLDWFRTHEEVVERILKKSGFPDSAEGVVTNVMGAMLSLLASLGDEAQRLGAEKTDIPRPAPGQSDFDCIKSIADAVWDKSMEMFGQKDNPLAMYVFLLNIPMYLLGELSQKERDVVRRSAGELLFEMFPACMAFFDYLCQRQKDLLLKEVRKAEAKGQASSSAPTQGLAVSPDFFKNNAMPIHHS